ncbi:thioredoxin domain-containing protein [Salinibaculum rarum]|uniref:thioredoxin domain-containing protein n=1 Tax=Salinibaculum rarum TaxID=3058903 RepID=UPI00265EB318|nr:thioredoxin domain-containing protein [Salinibaculum sp. KK48]
MDDERVQALRKRVTDSAEIFLSNPFTGDTLRALVTGDVYSTDENPVTGLPAPTRCEDSAPVIVAQYVDYAANRAPTYWHSVLPEIEHQYGTRIRYEHHDAPPLDSSTLSYKLATIGRCIQDQRGDGVFWDWIDLLMKRGVSSVEEAYGLGVEIGVEKEQLQTAVQSDTYGEVIRHDAQSALAQLPTTENATQGADRSANSPTFIVLVNGKQVQPTYESIVGAIERLKYGAPNQRQ